MKEFIEYVTKQLVEHPSQVHVDEIIGQHTVIYALRVGDEDMGKVIGKRGRTADSIRTLLTATAARQGKRSILEIVETNRMGQNLQKNE
ncbi:KH domain-containing protein [bacterium]|nr:KH domain-containing protein [candidate division CSSED10-310 bacterium]